MNWEGFIAFENQETGDDRMFTPDALFWNTPVPLFYSHETAANPDGPVGTIHTIERLEGGVIYGAGTFMDTEDGRAAAMACHERTAAGMDMGVSVDLDEVSMELRIRSELFDGDAAEEMSAQTDENGRITVASVNSGDFMTVFTRALIRGASMTSMPAFVDASIRPMPEGHESPGEMPGSSEMRAESETFEEIIADIETESLVASAFPLAPPSEWFENPQFSGETPIQVDDSGRFYGHIATWNTFHISFAGQKITPPRSMVDYAYFRKGVIRTAEGTDIAIGTITMDTGHADSGMSPMDTLAHYDNTGTVVCDVVIGDDEFGIWAAGALRPSVTDEQVRALRAASLSGDWREIRGNLELVAVLAVNTGGFPIPRMSAMVASGEVRTLVASAAFGVVVEEVELTREEKLALREIVAERNSAFGTESPGIPSESPAVEDVITEEPVQEEPSGPAEGVLEVEDTVGMDEFRKARIDAAMRKFRIERAKARAAKARS